MLDWIIDIDKQLFVFLNSHHNETWDSIMSWITAKQSWFPFYLVLIIFLTYQFRNGKGIFKREFWFVFISIAILITLTEQIASGFFKPFIERFRPCHEPTLEGLVHTINGKCGGQFGYFSAHASNTFGLAGFIFLLLKNEIKLKWIGIFLFFWAAIVSYSRVYVGVHYPLDIISGAVCGILVSILIHKLYVISVNKILHKH